MNTTTSISSFSEHRWLRLAMMTEYNIHRTRTQFGDRAFSVAGPREWNTLPANLKNITDLSSFKRDINTFLYWHIRINTVFLDCIIIGLLDTFQGCKMRHINGVYLLNYFNYVVDDDFAVTSFFFTFVIERSMNTNTNTTSD